MVSFRATIYCEKKAFKELIRQGIRTNEESVLLEKDNLTRPLLV